MKNVKRIAVLAMMCCCVFAFTSCQKDGMYKPKKRIAEISLQENGGDTKVVEKWTWSKGLLSQINYVDDEYIATFEYDGKQISKVVTSTGESLTFVYDGKYIQSATIADGEDVVAEYTYKHNDDHLISGIDAEVSTDFNVKTTRLAQLANRFITPAIAEQQNSIMTKAKGKYKVSQTFTYDGKNIVSSHTEYSTGGKYDTEYTYTEYNNPFYHYFEFSAENMSLNALSGSTTTNNIISTQTDIVEVTYPKVDGKFPTQATYVYTTKQHVGNFDNNYANGTDNYFYVYE